MPAGDTEAMALRFCLVLALFGSVDASLRGKLHAAAGTMSAEQLRETVLQEVRAALGSGNRVTQQRLKVIEDAARPSFEAMPKNEFGNLEDAAARYVLHRLFVQRHAIHIKGLEASGMEWKNMSTSEVLQDHVPSFVLSLFEDRLKGQGLGLHELAVLAATLEHLIHDEAVARLSAVYQAHNVACSDLVFIIYIYIFIGLAFWLKGICKLSSNIPQGWWRSRAFRQSRYLKRPAWTRMAFRPGSSIMFAP